MSKKVMIIDDDREFLDEISEILIFGGYTITAVNDPAMVINKLDKVRPDVILIDMRMPGKSGYELASELKSLERSKNIPIIGMTAFYRDNDLPVMTICGIKKCLKKPFYPLDVINYIETAL